MLRHGNPGEKEGEKMADDVLTYGLHLEVGMLLEVLNESNEVLFRARVEEFDGDSMKIVNDSGGEMPIVMYNTEFKLRGHYDNQTAIYHGTSAAARPICGSSIRSQTGLLGSAVNFSARIFRWKR